MALTTADTPPRLAIDDPASQFANSNGLPRLRVRLGRSRTDVNQIIGVELESLPRRRVAAQQSRLHWNRQEFDW
jgi:hypothetical protein